MKHHGGQTAMTFEEFQNSNQPWMCRPCKYAAFIAEVTGISPLSTDHVILMHCITFSAENVNIPIDEICNTPACQTFLEKQVRSCLQKQGEHVLCDIDDDKGRLLHVPATAIQDLYAYNDFLELTAQQRKSERTKSQALTVCKGIGELTQAFQHDTQHDCMVTSFNDAAECSIARSGGEEIHQLLKENLRLKNPIASFHGLPGNVPIARLLQVCEESAQFWVLHDLLGQEFCVRDEEPDDPNAYTATEVDAKQSGSELAIGSSEVRTAAVISLNQKQNNESRAQKRKATLQAKLQKAKKDGDTSEQARLSVKLYGVENEMFPITTKFAESLSTNLESMAHGQQRHGKSVKSTALVLLPWIEDKDVISKSHKLAFKSQARKAEAAHNGILQHATSGGQIPPKLQAVYQKYIAHITSTVEERLSFQDAKHLDDLYGRFAKEMVTPWKQKLDEVIMSNKKNTTVRTVREQDSDEVVQLEQILGLVKGGEVYAGFTKTWREVKAQEAVSAKKHKHEVLKFDYAIQEAANNEFFDEVAELSKRRANLLGRRHVQRGPQVSWKNSKGQKFRSNVGLARHLVKNTAIPTSNLTKPSDHDIAARQVKHSEFNKRKRDTQPEPASSLQPAASTRPCANVDQAPVIIFDCDDESSSVVLPLKPGDAAKPVLQSENGTVNTKIKAQSPCLDLIDLC
jgi:hypothetical protein